jgi:uncharacterized low-complexity protein
MQKSIQLALITALLLSLGCAGKTVQTESTATESTASSETATEGSLAKSDGSPGNIDSDTSDVLAKKSQPKEARCPKRAKLVKGKCVLPVEETE